MYLITNTSYKKKNEEDFIDDYGSCIDFILCCMFLW